VGDEFARAGEWAQAVAAWNRALDAGDRQAATQRLRWFLDETDGPGAGTAARAAPQRAGRVRLLLAVAGGAIVGTVCVFLGQDQTGSARNVLAAVAWLAYIAAAALAVTYAFASGRRVRSTDAGLTAAELCRARDLAAVISRSDGPDHPPV